MLSEEDSATIGGAPGRGDASREDSLEDGAAENPGEVAREEGPEGCKLGSRDGMGEDTSGELEPVAARAKEMGESMLDEVVYDLDSALIRRLSSGEA